MAIYTRFEYTSFLSFSFLPGPNDISVLIPLLIILLLFLLIVVAVIVICCKRYVQLSVVPFCAVIIILLVMVAVLVAVPGSTFIVTRRPDKLFHVCIVDIQYRFSIDFCRKYDKTFSKQKQNGAVCYPERYTFFSLILIFFSFSRDVWLRARKATLIFKKKAT